MKTQITFIVSLLSIFFFVNPLFAAIPGEPVPGGEIYIELEPDDEPIIPVDNGEGDFTFTGLEPGTYSVIVNLPSTNTLSVYTNEKAKEYPKIKESGYYHKKNQYFLSKNKGLFLIQLKEIKSIDLKSINVASKQIKGKDSKNKTCILKFNVPSKNSKIVFNLKSITPEEYNGQITDACAGGPFSQSLSNIEDNGRQATEPK
jgi:hypothetical protein